MLFGTLLLVVGLAAVQVSAANGVKESDFNRRVARSPQEEIPDELKPHKPSQPVFEPRVARSADADLLEDMHELEADLEEELFRERRSMPPRRPPTDYLGMIARPRSGPPQPPNPPPPVLKGLPDPKVQYRQSCPPECP